MSSSAVRDQTRAITRQAASFVAENERILESLKLLLENPGRDSGHTYTEIVRLVAQVWQTAGLSAMALALVAHRDPAMVSQRSLAAALGISVNTLRRRLLTQKDDVGDPFADEDGGS